MNFLVDTNIFLEILLDQDKKEKCKEFLSQNISQLNISDFSLHSIGVILTHQKKTILLEKFFLDILPKINLIFLSKEKYLLIPSVSKKYNLDFDDTYQTCLAQEFSLRIVTMDKDFNKVKDILEIEAL